MPSKILGISKTYLKHQIRSKIATISVVQVFTFDFALHDFFYTLGAPIFRKNLRVFIINIIIIIITIIIIIIELTRSKTILENTVEIKPQPVALDFKNLSQYCSRSK